MLMPNRDKERIFSVFTCLFHISPQKLSSETRRDHIEGWDSLGHIALVDALNEEFGVSISPEQALEMETIGDIDRMLAALK